MDQSATTAAFVSGMKEDLKLYGNELVEFTTYFSIGYAIFIVPSQIIQTRVRPSIFLPICEIIWGLFTLFTYKAPNAKTIFALRFFLGVFESTSWPGIVNLIFNWYVINSLDTVESVTNIGTGIVLKNLVNDWPFSASVVSQETCSSVSSKPHSTKTSTVSQVTLAGNGCSSSVV